MSPYFNMVSRQLASRAASSLVSLLVTGNAIGVAAQPPQKPPPQGHIPPGHVILPARQFADIHVTVLGPALVRIDWAPLAGANNYFVQRNGAPIGPDFQSDPAATASLSFTDDGAPIHSNLTYAVVAVSPSTFYSMNGSKHTRELQHVSNAIAVVTPAIPPPRSALRPDAAPSIASNSEVVL